VIYAFKSGSYIPTSVDPAAAYARIANLREQGLSQPGDIVDDARPEDSPLHDAFTWDDGEAADKFRLQEARHLCNSIIIIRDETPGAPEAPAIVSVVDHKTFDRAYVTTIEAYSDADYRKQMLADAKAGLLAWRHRYNQLEKELGRIFAVIDEVVSGAP
jgi:hypothetical protein